MNDFSAPHLADMDLINADGVATQAYDSRSVLQQAYDKLTTDEFAAIVNAAKADAYRDVRRELVWNTESYKAQVQEIVHLSDKLADLVTANGGHYRKPSLSPRFPWGTPEHDTYAASIRDGHNNPPAFAFLEN